MVCYLVRHGQDDETIRGGWSDHPLTDTGIRQAEELAQKLTSITKNAKIHCIYSSDLRRAMQTSQILAEKLCLPVVPLAQFREVNNGDLAGMQNDTALIQYPGLFWNQLRWDQPYPNGESPIFLRKIRLKYRVSAYPQASATWAETAPPPRT